MLGINHNARESLLEPLRSRWVGLVLCCALVAGCNQSTPTGYSAWNPFGQPYGDPSSPQYVEQLRLQAERQYQLAMEHQKQLAAAESLQKQNAAQMAQTQTEAEQARSLALRQQEQQQAMLVQEAREALGRYDTLGQRAQNLDLNNQDLHARIAQVQQRTQLLEDQNQLLRQRLDDTSKQLAVALDESKRSQERLQTMMTSTQRRSGATITANNSYRRSLTAVTVAGLSVRQDGDLVRIELSSDQLFQEESATLKPDAAMHIDQVADVILNNYSRQVIGVEAHTDGAPANTNVWRNAHQLTAAQAMAVFEQLSYRNRLLPQQMFILGHGANFALASNATEAGKARNRRIEIVVYPEAVGQR